MAATPIQRPSWMRAGGMSEFRLRDFLSFRWAAIAVIVIGWFVYYPIIDNFLVSTKNQDIFT